MSLSGRDILVVEDSDEDYDTVREVALAAGVVQPLRRAITGGDGLSLLRGDSAAPMRPTFVLLDLNSPGVDGREALREIKSDPDLKSIPVIVFSTSDNSRDLNYCYATGANAYHVKPVRYNEHREVLRAIFDYWLGAVALPTEGDRG